jgi:ABC-2 type transport system ATP-binding protein
MISAQHLRKDFSTVRAVDDVSFAVGRGEILGLLGPNGAGKTTAIRMVLDILQADGGTITYDGAPMSPAVRNRLGYLPEERGLYRKSKVFDTVLYFAELRGMAHGAAKSAAHAWLERFGLWEHASRKVEELSKGNQQKIQFIIAAIHRPDLVILDEPFSGLDPLNQELFKDAIRELKQQQRAVIFSTHQMDQAEKLSDSICLINKGRVVLGGSVHEVKRRYGSNALRVQFDGDGSFMSGLPGVRHASLYENSAELELASDAAVRDLLSRINGAVDVRKFEIVEPSLHSIFLSVVGGEAPPEEAAR